MPKKLLFSDETYEIRGACFEVYKEKGCGFAEAVYQECLEIEMELRGMPFLRQPILEIEYKGRTLESKFVPDLICYDAIVVELKPSQKSQTTTGLNCTTILRRPD
jgi:GxxExxY protein